MSAATIERPTTRRRTARATGAWADFIKVYRDHLTWLLAQGQGWAEGATEGARRANALVARVCEDLETRSFHAQRGAVGGLNDLWQEIEAAIEAGGEDQPREWDQFLDMSVDFAGRAFGLADTKAIDTQHVNYLADLAAAQAALARLLNHTPESWAEQRVNRRAAAEVEVQSEDLGARRALAFDAYHQITALGDGLKKLVSEHGASTGRLDEAQMHLGVLSRVQLLADIIFHAVRLDGTDGSPWGDWDDLVRLRRAFDGGMA